MTIQLSIPSDLSSLGRGSVNLLLLEAYGYSSDGKTLLVRATFTDSADTTSQFHYGMWTYNLVTSEYVTCLNKIFSSLTPNNIDVPFASIGDNKSTQVIVAQASSRDGGSDPILAKIVNGSVETADLIGSLLGSGASIPIQSFKISGDMRFLALQTDSPLLASSVQDTNESSDIYVVDLTNTTLEATRVSMVGGAGVDEPAYLSSIRSSNGSLQISFTTDANFISAQIDKNAAFDNSEAKRDAYVWSQNYSSLGFTGSPTINLVSTTSANIASGYVSSSNPILLTSRGSFFSSSSPDIVSGDTNNSVDGFFKNNANVVSKINLNGITQLSLGASVVSVSSDGLLALILTSSPEVVGYGGLDQLVLVNVQTGLWQKISSGIEAINDIIIAGDIDPMGATVAYTTAATNLVSEPLVAPSGSLFISNNTLVSNISGHVYHWKTHVLMDDVNLIADSNSSAISSLGQYTLSNLTLGSHTLVASRTATNDSAGSAITSADALAALKIAVGSNPNIDPDGSGPRVAPSLSPFQFMAADVNGDGRVTSSDALAILKMAVKNPSALTPAWIFADESQVFNLTRSSVKYDTTINKSLTSDLEVNLVAVLKGDVNGSWGSRVAASTQVDYGDSSYFTNLAASLKVNTDVWGIS